MDHDIIKSQRTLFELAKERREIALQWLKNVSEHSAESDQV